MNEPHIPELPPRIKYILSAVILAVGIAGCVGLALLKQSPATQENKSIVPEVATFRAIDFTGDLSLEVSGLVVPHREIRIPAQVAGKVSSKSACFEAGTYVQEGELLMKIDPTDYQLAVERLRAELEQSNSMLTELEEEMKGVRANIELAKEEVQLLEEEKARKERIRSAVSQADMDLVKRNLINARKNLQSLQNNLALLKSRKHRLENGAKLSQAQLDQALADLERTKITAPANGVVVSQSVEQGDFVQKGEIVGVFEDTSKAEVECNLRAKQLDWLIQNTQYRGDTPEDAYRLPPTEVDVIGRVGDREVTWPGVLSRYDGIGLDEQTKTIPCRVEVPNPIAQTPYGQRPLVRGMYVRVKVKIPTAGPTGPRQFLEIPAEAVQPGNYVWKVVNQRLSKCDITIVDQHHREAEEGDAGDGGQKMFVVLQENGLKVGDKIVVSPLAQPTNQAKVREKSAS